METRQTACPLDCPDACSMAVEVEDGRVVSLDGTHANPVTGGFICAKVRRFPAAMYGDDRILRPMIRTGEKGRGEFRPISWDRALALVAEKVEDVRERFGGESILPFSYGGSNGLLSQDTTDARLFWRLGASRLARTVCAVATGRAAEGLYGKMPGTALSDYVHARLIVVWGANPSASGIHLIPYIQEAQKRGAKLVVVDPRRTKLAHRADLHLAPRPGTDLPLALALIRWLFEHAAEDRKFLDAHATGVEGLREKSAEWSLEHAANICQLPAQDIDSFARLYAESNPAVIRCGWGLERNRNGGSAVAAVLALPAVAGKFGVRGGGYTLSNSAAWGLDPAVAANTGPPRTRIINMNQLGSALTPETDPPVKFLFVYNSNPLTTLPRQGAVRHGLLRDDLFTVVFDSFLTDTARYADVLLPAATFLERREISRGYGAYVLQDSGAVAAPVGESRSNHDVFLELCRRLGLDRPKDPETEDEVRSTIFGAHPEGTGWETALRERGLAVPAFGGEPVQFVDVFPRTENRRVHLLPASLDREAPLGLYAYQPDPATKEYPLVLISPATNRTVSSMLGQLHREQVPLDMHNADAVSRGIKDGDTVRVFNALGEVRCKVKRNPLVRIGVVQLPKGIWSHNTLSGTTSNTLVPDTLTDLGDGACFNDARVQVERLSDET